MMLARLILHRAQHTIEKIEVNTAGLAECYVVL